MTNYKPLPTNNRILPLNLGICIGRGGWCESFKVQYAREFHMWFGTFCGLVFLKSLFLSRLLFLPFHHFLHLFLRDFCRLERFDRRSLSSSTFLH
ncbi:hypothetical protein CPB83DRAFT_864811 [Crepidotus variabilis]|uniref:Uncharacterized protein n=1 Tax=Crepidotus variabilis TaxID=179855 RepID=A0A9P6E435_9AGAR|nr:hypothetical protein CPB83DRAFT_864811 [Crepidotus variabilis]